MKMNKTMKNKMCAGLIAGLSVFAMVGCGDDAKEALGNVTEDASLQGRFVEECGSSELLNLSERNALMFQGNDFTRTQSFFTSADCQEEGAKIDYQGTFTIDPDALPNSEAGSIDIKVEKAVLTINNETAAEALSAIGFCGIKEFPVGQEITIEGKGTEGTCPLMNLPSERFGAYKVDGDKLYLDGDLSSMAETKENRAETLESEAYIRD